MKAPLSFTLAALVILAIGHWRTRRRWKVFDVAQKVVFTGAMVIFMLFVTGRGMGFSSLLVGLFIALVAALQLIVLNKK